MIIAGLDKHNNDSYICFFILLCYRDQISFELLFKFLKENYRFLPKNVHLDADKIFSPKPKLIYCFFHFVQSVIKRIRILKL